MNHRDVHIVSLGPMRVASFDAFGRFPEKEAWRVLEMWAAPKGLLRNRNEHPVFGFKNSSPWSAGDDSGYEIWIKIGFGVEPDGQARIVDYPGGPYAVLRCSAYSFNDTVVEDEWNYVAEWCRNNNIRPGYHQPLEKFITVEGRRKNLVVDLYYPIIY